MEQWKYVTIMVTVVAFVLQIRPLTAFMAAYLTSPDVHVSLYEVSNVLTPITLYAAVFSSLLVFLATDYLRYKPIIMLNAFLGMVAYFNFADSPSLLQLKIGEGCLSIYLAGEVAYYGYLYAMIKDRKRFQIATGCAKAATLSGSCVSGIIGQLVVSLNGYSTLTYYSFVGATFALVWSCFMPSVEQSQYFYKMNEADFSKMVIHNPDIPKYSQENAKTPNDQERRNTIMITTTSDTNPFGKLYGDLKNSFADLTVSKWSFWHIFSLAGYMQACSYANVLYTYDADNMPGNQNNHFNGLVDSISTACGAICAYCIGKVYVDWSYYGNTFLALGSLMLGLTMCLCYFFKPIIYVYAMYILCVTVLQSMFVISVSQIAKRLKEDCYVLVLGFNVFLAILVATCSSLFLVQIMEVSILTQFLFYGIMYTSLGILYGCASLFENKTTEFNQLP